MNDAETMFATRADKIGAHPRSAFWVKRLTPMCPPILEAGAYGQVIREVKPGDVEAGKATRQRAFPRSGYYEYGHFDKDSKGEVVIPTIELPNGLVPPTGTDSQFNVRQSDGRMLDVWGYRTRWLCTQSNPWAGAFEWELLKLYARRGIGDWDAVAGTVAFIGKDERGNGNFWCPSAPIYPGVPSAAEFEAGVIPHALSWSITITMGGNIAPRTILNNDHKDIGVKWKVAHAPAQGIEANLSGSTPTVGFGIPMGSRFRLNPRKWTAAKHKLWLKGKPLGQQKAANTFGRALLDYGMVSNQSCGWDAFPLNPTDAARYTAAGAVPNLPDGIDWSCAQMLRSPVATYLDGTTGTREGQCSKFGYV